MKRPFSPQQISERIRIIHGDQITLDEGTYVDTRTRCRFVDRDFGEWWTDPWSVLCGRHHPKRGRMSMGQKQTVTREIVEQKLHRIFGDQIKLGDDFVGMSTKCTFVDKVYGSWCNLPQRVLLGTCHPKRRAEKARQTCLKRYGVVHTNHLPEVRKKFAITQRHWSKSKHWKTNDELICMSSYEIAFVRWCNENKIDFDWQIKHEMPDGHAYYVDAHILDGQFADTWIEIKGWMRKEGLRKWEWFHSAHPNSQLWTCDVLKRIGIL